MKSPCKACSPQSCYCIFPKPKEDNFESPMGHFCDTSTPDKKYQRRLHNFMCNSPLQMIQSSLRNDNTASTPTKNPSLVTTNPFELEVDSLHALSYSPSVFSVTRKTPDQKSPFWSIDQLSMLKPADIDESSQQEFCLRLDAEKELKAQEAIDVFFSKNCIAPSPWTPAIKYTSFAPHLASTACQSKIEIQHMAYESCEEVNENADSKSVSTQTTLTIPPSLDLMTLLGHFYTYHANLPRESLDTSFRRRKLFINDDEEEEEDKVSIHSPINHEPNNNILSKLAREEVVNSPWTPIADHFSSSPMGTRKFDLSTNGTISLMSPNISPISSPSSTDTTPKSRRHLDRSWRKDCCAALKDTDSTTTIADKEPLETSTETRDNSIMMTSVLETECTASSNINPDQMTDSKMQPNSENNTFSSSLYQRDTGYLTGSIDTMASMTSQQLMDFGQYRTTPIAELLVNCDIESKGGTNYSTFCAMDESMMSASNDCSNISINPTSFSSLPWEPNTFSTPTKSRPFKNL